MEDKTLEQNKNSYGVSGRSGDGGRWRWGEVEMGVGGDGRWGEVKMGYKSQE